MFHADLHIHSRFSRACSKDCDIEHLSLVGAAQGPDRARHRRLHPPRVGRGAEGHPGRGRARAVPGPARSWNGGWRAIPRPAAPGPSGSCCRSKSRPSTAATSGPGRSITCSTRRASRPRTGSPRRWPRSATWPPTAGPSSGSIRATCWRSRLSAGPGCFLVPAHVWTPWFAVLGSKSGFDAVQDCYADLAGAHLRRGDRPVLGSGHELDLLVAGSPTGWSATPTRTRRRCWAARRRCSAPTLDYFAMAEALRTGRRPGGHPRVLSRGGEVPPGRAPQVRDPGRAGADPRARGRVPGVRQAADGRRAAPGRGACRPPGRIPARPARPGFTCLVQLPEIIGRDPRPPGRRARR